ncbi:MULTISPECIES: ABC transporter substrate-binding protein [Halobacterium]|nr:MULTISPECIES: ABC transporter substrate-binding protein [Halobacterium]MBB6089477.1 peptide/nickel transport system substrate-binding protein [Halobacterium salinarum]MCF2208554.1 ABC transporter substrate-binding protein [Halobacterium salinarum]MDL0126932.1 ABC transporter substrate-binding protein [Halobacterium salinarum]MDL0131766.1 ABC transporter substrate-binding protein [Halobacterium salinarum]MDL0136909.1 ABC transporter substrate-binding protein [Halobacterium salinarum]
MSDDTVSRRGFLKAAGAATVVATSTAGCTDSGGGGDGGGDELVYSRGDHPQNYDPQQTTSGEVSKVTNQIFDTLIQFKPGTSGELTSGLADDWTLDGTTATLTLREDATFHSGADLTATDVKATIRRFIDDEYDYYLGSDRSGYASITFGDWVDSVEATGDYEVTIDLTQQYAPFLRNLAIFAAAILSRDQIESLGADAQPELGTDPVGTGPFEFDQLDNETQRVRLTAFDDYWGGAPSVSAVIFKTTGSNQTRAQGLINGDAHITDNLDAQSIQKVSSADSASVRQKNGINVGYMAFNHDRKPAFRDPLVKRAISMAINRDEIVDSIYQGFAASANQPLPPDVLGHNDDIDSYPHDPQQAESMLADAGVTDLSFELATFSNPRGYNPNPIQTATQVKSDLAEIGVDVEINQFSQFSAYLEYTYDGRHDACLSGWYTDNADPDNFMYVLLHPGTDIDDVPADQNYIAWEDKNNVSNVSAWVDTDYMEFVDKGQRTYDDAARQQYYHQASQIAHDQAPWVYLDYADLIRGVNEAVVAESYTPTSVGGPFLDRVELA